MQVTTGGVLFIDPGFGSSVTNLPLEIQRSNN